MSAKRFESIWDAIEDTPEEAANMEARATLMLLLADVVKHWETTQVEAAQRLKISQPRLNDLLRGKINKFSLDALVALSARASYRVQIKLLRRTA